MFILQWTVDWEWNSQRMCTSDFCAVSSEQCPLSTIAPNYVTCPLTCSLTYTCGHFSLLTATHHTRDPADSALQYLTPTCPSTTQSVFSLCSTGNSVIGVVSSTRTSHLPLRSPHRLVPCLLCLFGMARLVGRKRQQRDVASQAVDAAASAAKRLRANRTQTHHLVSLSNGTLVLINLTHTEGVDHCPLLTLLTGPGRDVAPGIVEFLSPDQLLDMRATCKSLLPVTTRAIVRLSQRLFTATCGLRDYIYYRHCWQRTYDLTATYIEYDRPRINKTDAMRTYLLSRAEVEALPARRQQRPVVVTLLAVEDVLRAVAVKYGGIMAWQAGEAKREARRLRRLRLREEREERRRPRWRQQRQLQANAEPTWRSTMPTLLSLFHRICAMWS